MRGVLTGLSAAFNQTEQGRQQGGKGTGLGLALVRQIVKLSGGRLGVQSKVGSGSTFWVELRELFWPGLRDVKTDVLCSFGGGQKGIVIGHVFTVGETSVGSE